MSDTVLPLSAPGRAIGTLLRARRLKRRLSQLDLALSAEVSQRHLSCVESGRAAPSRDMVLRLAEQLEAPLRDQNILLIAAGFAPVYSERPLDHPALAAAKEVVETLLRALAPNPAYAVDRHWHLVASNDSIAPFLAGVTERSLLEPPVNLLRLALHPGGLAPATANLPVWRAHVLERLRRQADITGDPFLSRLLTELAAYGPETPAGHAPPSADVIAVPLEMDTAEGRVSFISTTTVFGTPAEVTLSELAIEAFYPADPASAERLRRLQAASESTAL